MVFPKVLETTQLAWEEDKIVLVRGKLTDKEGAFKLLCDGVKTVNSQEIEEFKRILTTQKSNGASATSCADQFPKNSQKLIITLPSDCNQNTLQKLSQFLSHCEQGSMKVYLTVNNSKLETPYQIDNREYLMDDLKVIAPESKVEIV